MKTERELAHAQLQIERQVVHQDICALNVVPTMKNWGKIGTVPTSGVKMLLWGQGAQPCVLVRPVASGGGGSLKGKIQAQHEGERAMATHREAELQLLGFIK